MNYLNPIKHWLLRLSRKERISLAALSTAILILTISLSWWTLSPSYLPLFSQLDPQDASQVIDELDKSHIAYRLSNQGQDIAINEKLVDKTRLQLMGSNLQFKGTIGFELFDRNDFGMTEFSRKINYQRALQGELERTINSLDEVSQTRVHLVLPEEHLFQEQSNQPQAAVTLHLTKPLKHQQIQSIQQLIAASVPRLNKKEVIIVDQNGRNLSGSSEEEPLSHLAFKKALERHLNNKVTGILSHVLPDEQIAVNVDVSLNYDELQRESLLPQQDGKITHEKEVRHASEDKMKKNKLNEDLSLEKNFQFGTEKEQFKRAVGFIEHLSISVALPATTRPETRLQIEKLVKASTGFDEKRGDQISVEAIIQKPIKQDAVDTKILIKKSSIDRQLLWLVFLLALSFSGVIISRQLRFRKTRQLLLHDLSQWLEERSGL